MAERESHIEGSDRGGGVGRGDRNREGVIGLGRNKEGGGVEKE